MRIQRFLLFVAAAGTALIGSGYATAYWGQSVCEARMRAEVMEKTVTGLDMEGRVILPTDIPIYSRIEYPFVVVAGYAVPYDLHASYHEAHFIVLPGYVSRQVSSKHQAM